jgi:hypothetical protein
MKAYFISSLLNAIFCCKFCKELRKFKISPLDPIRRTVSSLRLIIFLDRIHLTPLLFTAIFTANQIKNPWIRLNKEEVNVSINKLKTLKTGVF